MDVSDTHDEKLLIDVLLTLVFPFSGECVSLITALPQLRHMPPLRNELYARLVLHPVRKADIALLDGK